MCQSAPGTVVALDADGTVVVRERGRDRRAIPTGDPLSVGDRVLVHAGLVVRRLNEDDAAAADAVWDELEVEG